VPALRKHRPELILVSSGFDASGFDPLARMMLHSETYRLMARMLKEVTSELCQGRLVLAHEGDILQFTRHTAGWRLWKSFLTAAAR
jgi:acetoin utilization deacetylase AcuC-like enzyme